MHNISPYEKLHGRPCDISNLRVFGCLCYSNTLKAHRLKLDPRAHPCIFIGFKLYTKGYLVYDLHSHSITSSRNIIFYENHFPHFSETQHSNLTPTVSAPGSFSGNHLHPPVETIPTHPKVQNSSNQADPFSPHLRRSTRTKHAPPYLQDYHHDLTSLTANTSNIVRYPLSSVLSYSRLSPSHRHFVMSISSNH